MKVCMLKTQILRFSAAGISHAELRLGYGGLVNMKDLKSVTRDIDMWIARKGDVEGEVGDAEIWLRPCLPPSHP
jgi:hypothetical protein